MLKYWSICRSLLITWAIIIAKPAPDLNCSTRATGSFCNVARSCCENLMRLYTVWESLRIPRSNELYQVLTGDPANYSRQKSFEGCIAELAVRFCLFLRARLSLLSLRLVYSTQLWLEHIKCYRLWDPVTKPQLLEVRSGNTSCQTQYGQVRIPHCS